MQFAMAIRKTYSHQLAIWRKLEYVRNELLENLHKMQRPCVVVPQVQEARITAHGDQGQLWVTTKSMHRRVQTLKHKPPSPVVRRQLIEEPRLHEYDEGGASGNK